MASPARDEREQLCDLFLEVGPDAPTLCGDWTTRDLAAHLVVRERRPDGAVGILAKPLAGYAEKVRAHEAARDYDDLVERVRTGPPLLSPMRPALVERLVNTFEYFVHHEDVRRASGTWAGRELDDDLTRDLLRLFPRAAKMLARKSPAGLVFVPDGSDPIVAKKPGPDGHSVTVSGPIGELVLFMYGRQAHALVDLAGPDDSIEAVRTASFGV
jgi:uncharacterized protein (TIGR03085 family)